MQHHYLAINGDNTNQLQAQITYSRTKREKTYLDFRVSTKSLQT